MLILNIAVPSHFRHTLDYLPPPHSPQHSLQPGCRLWVTLGRRKAVGILIAVKNNSDLPQEKLKPALDWIDEQPILPAHLLQLGQWASQYYQHPIGEVMAHLLPPALRQGQSDHNQNTCVWQLSLQGALLETAHRKKLSPKQQQAVQLLEEHRQGLTTHTLAHLGIAHTTLNHLQKKQWINCHAIQQTEKTETATLAEAELQLNTEQKTALNVLQNHTERFQCFLLEGVTGSGKTEVYLQWISLLLQQNKQILILVPEIGLTPQTISRFKQRFKANIIALHSRLSDKEKLDAWYAAKTGVAHIIIGTRSSIFMPLPKIGAIIVDEEHDPSFKQQSGFRYSARDLAVYRAKLENIPILLGSATPSLESLKNCQQGRYHKLVLSQRAGNAKAPDFQILDMRDIELKNGLHPQILTHIQQTLDRQEQVLVFINRRGYAPSLLCHHCGWSARCNACDAHLTLYAKSARLLCHHCGDTQPVPIFCPSCHSSDLRGLGMGTERIEENLQALFSRNTIIRVDKDTTKNKMAFQQTLSHIHQAQPLILVGTQMLAKGHHFPLVTLVVLLNMDAGLYTSDFRGPERTAQLILQVSGRAGRADKPGQVLLQTHTPQHPLLMHIAQGYHPFAEQELAQRQAAHLPPFYPMALIGAEAKSTEQAQNLLSQLAAYLRQNADLEILGPIPALMEKKAHYYRAQLILSAERASLLQQSLSQAIAWLDQSPQAKKVRWWLDVDPIETQ